jgi:hypothetical protein
MSVGVVTMIIMQNIKFCTLQIRPSNRLDSEQLQQAKTRMLWGYRARAQRVQKGYSFPPIEFNSQVSLFD